jgi:nitrogen fixation protein NifU and related proteins
MDDTRELYQELILDHNRNPRNCRKIDAPDRRADGYNPLCGDHVSVTVKLDGDRVADVAFEGSGCAISTASASLMTEALKGKTLSEAKAIFDKFHALVTGQEQDGESDSSMRKLKVFSGVCNYPARVKCATLVWHTLQAALEGKSQATSTE